MLIPAALLLASIASAVPGANATAPFLSRSDARHIMLRYLDDNRITRRPGFALDSFDSRWNPTFYFFEALFANPVPGSAVLGNWAVDSRTGDIWSAVVCEEERSPGAHALQMRIRARLHITPARYRQLRRAGPMCD